jgi:hypothetical protein
MGTRLRRKKGDSACARCETAKVSSALHDLIDRIANKQFAINPKEKPMPLQRRFPVSRTSITAVVLLLFAVGYAYSQGWFDLSRSSAEIEREKVSTDQRVEQ